jgi:chloramphenicol 3-O phosphotransferase
MSGPESGYDIVILNGVSSAGKTSLARAMQALLPEPWLTFGVDALISAMPFKLTNHPDGLVFRPDGGIDVGRFHAAATEQWRKALASLAEGGVKLILDEVMLEGAAEQALWNDTFAGRRVLWVAVRCDVAVAVERERARGDRHLGMAAWQATRVHEGLSYDFEVDTGRLTPAEAAALIVERVRG